MRDGADRSDVLHLERQRARTFDEHGARVRLHQRRDVGAGKRVVIGGGDAVAAENLVAEHARRLVDRISHQQMVARAQHGQKRGGHRREPGRQQRHAGAGFALELA